MESRVNIDRKFDVVPATNRESICNSTLTAVIVWDNLRNAWDTYQHLLGTDGMLGKMEKAISLVEAVEACYAAAVVLGYDDPFDFEFVPCFLYEYIVNKNEDIYSIATDICNQQGDTQ